MKCSAIHEGKCSAIISTSSLITGDLVPERTSAGPVEGREGDDGGGKTHN